MRRIERTNAFLRDFKREKRGHHRRELEMVLTVTVSLLAEDKPLPERNRIRWEENGATIGSVT
jgi:mRNA interferase YafQ